MSIFNFMRAGKNSLLQALRNQTCDINETDAHKNTALHVAVAANHKKLVKVLLKNNSNVNARNLHGFTPLLFVFENVIILQWFLQYGADVNAQDNNGWTALLYACNHKNYDIIEELLNFDANINLKAHYTISILDVSNSQVIQFIESYLNFLNKTKKLHMLWETEDVDIIM